MKIKKSRLFFAVLILFILAAVMAVSILLINLFEIRNQTEFRNSLTSKNVVRSLEMLESEMNKIYDTEVQKTEIEVKLMVSVLRKFVDGRRFSGSRVFADGVVVQIKGDQIVYPSDFSYHFDPLDADYLNSEPSFGMLTMVNEEDGSQAPVWITAKKISDDFCYIDWTTEEEYDEVISRQQDIFDMIKDLQESFNGYLFLFENLDPEMKCYYSPSGFENIDKAADLGFSKEDVDSKKPIVFPDYQDYFACFTSLRMFGVPLTAVFLINNTNMLSNTVSNIAVIMILTLITVLSTTLWLYWVRTYVCEHALTEAQKNNYRPAQVRRIIRSVGAIGVFLIFIISITLNSLGSLSLESANNNRLLDLMSERMDNREKFSSRFQSDIESWMVYYAQKLASVLIQYPEFRMTEFLAEANDLFESEYIILFDENGKEIVSSNGYIDLDLETDLAADGSDLIKLLRGAPKLIRVPEEDLIEGITIQLIGTSALLPDQNRYAALIIAIDPAKTWETEEKEEYAGFLSMIAPAGNACFVVERDTGTILFSSDEDAVGKRAGEVGLYQTEAPDTEMDVFRLTLGQMVWSYYGAYQQDENYQYYYMTFSDVIQTRTLSFSLSSALGFLLIYWIVSAIMLHSYRTKEYNETVTISKSSSHNSLFDVSVNTEWIRMQNDADEQENLWEIWKELLPEKKAAVFIQISFALLLITGLIRLFNSGSSGMGLAIDFILRGNWRRGINLLSFAGILLLIISFTIFILFEKILDTVISLTMDSKAKTIFRLVFSLIQYAAIIILLYFSFGYLGFDTRALLTSVSLLSLAVSLGAKDLVADILSGIFIIFEDDFHVGDIIDINGFSGIVQEIGVRSTKLIGIGDNVMIIGNQNIKNVLNMSRMNSWYSIDLKVPSDQPIREIEEMLEKELPEIGRSIPDILSGPYYKGIMSIGSVYTLYIIAECKQEDYRGVQRMLNHALMDLFNEHGYKLM